MPTSRPVYLVRAVEVVRGAVAPATLGTDGWWRAVAAVRETVYALARGGLSST